MNKKALEKRVEVLELALNDLAEAAAKCDGWERCPQEAIDLAYDVLKTRKDEMSQLDCDVCGCKVFLLARIDNCDDCEHNGFLTEDTAESYNYRFGKIPKREIERTMVRDESECALGESFDNGCYQFHCQRCGKKKHIPMV